jgi:hypothetical protein
MEPLGARMAGGMLTPAPGEFIARSQDEVVFGAGTAVPAVRGGAPLGGRGDTQESVPATLDFVCREAGIRTWV